MLKVICVDDDPIQNESLERMFESSPYPIQALFFLNSDAFLFNFEDHQDVDALFFDVEMDRMNGLELADRVREMGFQKPIIFVTGYSDYAIEGYRVQAFDYILKPINQDSINQLLARLGTDQPEHFLLLDTTSGLRRENDDAILGFEADGMQVRVILEDSSYHVKMSISQVKNELRDHFIVCHRSYIVNMNHIVSLHKDELILSNGETFPISRRLRTDVHRSVSDYYQKGDYQL